ncbi:hypothetical protein H0H92_014569 [Tricholoma furcatifolium]|nr:hypothetical protein H0H92_014569 [Tricholoma furcatifolium]
MTEYDYSPEAWEQHLHQQAQIARWVKKTSRTTPSNPYVAATPAGDIPRELLPDARIHDPNPPPGPGSNNGKPRVRRHRTPSEKQFDRERRDDWKYNSQRLYKEAVLAREEAKAREAAKAQEEAKLSTQASTPRTRRASYDGTRARREQPPTLTSVAPRLSDSQATSSTDKYSNAQRKRSQSTSAQLNDAKQLVAVRVSLQGKTYYAYDGELYNYDPTVNAQVDTSIDPWPTRKKPTRSQTAPAIPAPEALPPPPNSAPATTGYPGYYHGRYGSSSSSVPQQQYPQQPRLPHSSTSPYPTYTHSRSQTLPRAIPNANPLPNHYPYPYQHTPSPLAPPNSAGSYGHGYGSAATFPRYVQGGVRPVTPEAQVVTPYASPNPNPTPTPNPPPKSPSKPLLRRVFFWSKNGGTSTTSPTSPAAASASTPTLIPTTTSPPTSPTKSKPFKTKSTSPARPYTSPATPTPPPTTPTTIRSLFGPPPRNKLTKHPHPSAGGSRMSLEGMSRETSGTGSASVDEGWVRLSLDEAGVRERREKREKEKNRVREGRDDKVRDWEKDRDMGKERSRPSDRHRSRHHERSYERDREREKDRAREREDASKERERDRRR